MTYKKNEEPKIDNRIADWTPSGKALSDGTIFACSTDRISLAKELVRLTLQKKKLLKNIEDCRALIAAGSKKKEEVIQVAGGGSVRINWSKTSFAKEFRDKDFAGLPEDTTSLLSERGVLEPCIKISLNQKTIENLSIA